MNNAEEADAFVDSAVSERRRLIALAYRMLGTVAEAEDAVQDAYSRWYQLSGDERGSISNVQAWLTRVTSNICLDVLKSARRRRETYVGAWLPEPVPAGGRATTDPAELVAYDESVSTALLVVLDSMTPAERIAFVMHDVFKLPFDEVAGTLGRSAAAARQLATSARRRVSSERSHVAPPDEQAAVVSAFATACESGNLTDLLTVLAPAIELRADGGGVVTAAPRTIVGADKVARFLLGILAKQPDWRFDLRPTVDGLAIAFTRGSAVDGVASLRVVDGRVQDVWIMLNPAKLTRWR